MAEDVRDGSDVVEGARDDSGGGGLDVPADQVVLYRHVGCPYCERVVRVMDEHDLEYRSRFVVPTHSERDHVKRISGRRSVPVLVDRTAGITMSESANIVDHVEKTSGST